MAGSADVLALSGDLARLRGLTGVKWTRYPDDVLPCWVADMDLGTAPPVADALARLVARQDFGYGFSAHAALPGAWAAWQAARHGWQVDAGRVRVLCDVLQGVDLALMLGTRPGDGVVLLTPVYPPFFSCIEGIGRRVVDCPLEPGTWRVDAGRLEACVAAARADGPVTALILCSPHNPTGRVFVRSELEAIAAVAERHDLLVIADEIWGDVVFSGARHVPFASLSEAVADRTVTLASASKPFNLAGLRCAVAHVGPAALRERIEELPGHLLGAVGTPGAAASLAAWTEGAPWLGETVAFLERQRDHLASRVAAELPGVRMTLPEATYLVWLDLRERGPGDDPAAWLLEHARVALGSGPDFGVHGRGFARLNVATTRAVLDEAIDRMAGALQGR